MAGQKREQMRLLTLLTLIILTGCKNKITTNETEVNPNSGMGLVKSINDTVLYYVNPINKQMIFVMNLRHRKNDFYNTKISNDTIEFGETFLGEVELLEENGKIKLTHPVDTIVDSKATKQYMLVVKYKPQTKGLFEFKGLVSYDSIEFPFDYKFIVVDKGTRKHKYEFVGKMRQGFDSDKKD